jgi:hypothetical protein
MSDAIENEIHYTFPELTQIAANSMQDLIPPKSRKVYDFNIMKKLSRYKGKISEFSRGRIINYYCRTMRDIKDLGSAILVKVQNTKNYKSRLLTILGKFYLEIC